MAGISIISNFDVNQSVPIDSRLVATGSAEREAILYKYAGLKVYQVDVNRTFTFRGPLDTDWDVEGSGIYGGSGSLIGDTNINVGSVSTTVGSQSYDLVYQSDLADGTKVYFYNNFVRHSGYSATTDYKNIEFRHQFKWQNSSGMFDSSYISYNPIHSGSNPGAISFNTGFGTNLKETMRLTDDGRLGLGTNEPWNNLQIGSFSSTTRPMVFYNGSQTVIGSNWYWNGIDQFFDPNRSATKIVVDNGANRGILQIWNKRQGISNNFVNSITTNGFGRVGIQNQLPTVELDVNGSILSNRTIRGEVLVSSGTVSSDNKVLGKSFNFSSTLFQSSQADEQSIYTIATSTLDPTPRLMIKAGGTNSISTTGAYTQIFTNTEITANLEVTNNGRITNNEISTNLVSFLTSIGDGATSYDGIFNKLILPSFGATNFFTSSVTAYRVGANVNLSVEFTFLNNFQIDGSKFYGIQMFLIDNSYRFIPETYSVGSGIAFTASSYNPSQLEVFTVDKTGGSSPNIDLVASPNYFVLRLRTLKTSSANIGTDLITTTAIKSGTKFVGTVTYKAKPVLPVLPPTPPPPPNPPLVNSASLISAGYTVLSL